MAAGILLPKEKEINHLNDTDQGCVKTDEKREMIQLIGTAIERKGGPNKITVFYYLRRFKTRLQQLTTSFVPQL